MLDTTTLQSCDTRRLRLRATHSNHDLPSITAPLLYISFHFPLPNNSVGYSPRALPLNRDSILLTTTN